MQDYLAKSKSAVNADCPGDQVSWNAYSCHTIHTLPLQTKLPNAKC